MASNPVYLVRCLFLLHSLLPCVAYSCAVVDEKDHTTGAIQVCSMEHMNNFFIRMTLSLGRRKKDLSWVFHRINFQNYIHVNLSSYMAWLDMVDRQYPAYILDLRIEVLYTATAIPFIYSFSGNCAASAPISTFICL